MRDDEVRSDFRVLLVEDNPEHTFIAVTVIRQVLGQFSDVIVAESADEAIAVIEMFTRQDHPDLILVDLRLPDNGGFAVLAAVKASESCAPIPVFVITSSLYDSDVAQSYELGALAVLHKPLSRAGLREELIRLGKLPGSGESLRTGN